MKGSKYPDEIRERAVQELAITNNVSALARKLDIPETTLNQWKHEEEKNSNFVELREQKRLEVIEKCGQIMSKAMDKLLKELPEVKTLDAAKIFGICYDKRALALGESTVNAKINLSVEDLLEQLHQEQGEAYELDKESYSSVVND